MGNEHGLKAQGDAKGDKRQHQGYAGDDIRVQHGYVSRSPSQWSLDTGLMWLMDEGGAVPMTVATRAEIKGHDQCGGQSAHDRAASEHLGIPLRVKPPHWVLDLDWLKERTIMVRIGA